MLSLQRKHIAFSGLDLSSVHKTGILEKLFSVI